MGQNPNAIRAIPGQHTRIAIACHPPGAPYPGAYIPTRYPNAHPSGAPRSRYTRTEAERLIGHAAEIIRPDAYARTKRALPLPGLEPHVYSEAEYAAVAATVDRTVEDGVVVYPPPPQ